MGAAAAFSRVEFGIVGRTRGGGRTGNAVAASAYNLAARLEHNGVRYDFRRKRGEHAGGCVLLPPGAPPELRDPGTLWHAAETAERRADAQIARQVMLSIPREVPPDDRLAFAQAVVAPWISDGAAAQVDVHCPAAVDGDAQPHAHVLLSLRRVTDSGFAPTKAREWNTLFQEDKGRAERARIESRANAWLAAHGIAARLDLRSLAARGEDRPPEPTAPRSEWQRWQREGAEPERAPITVAAALKHRRRRADLARADLDQAEAARDVADLARTLAEVEARAAPAAAIPPEARTRPATAPPVSREPPRYPPAADRRAAAEAAWQACRAGWQADRPHPEPREDLRARHRAEREDVYRLTTRGTWRTAVLARLAQRQAGERIAVRADQLARTWTAAPRESVDGWIARRAAEGHPDAATVTDARERAAARQAARDPAGTARRALDARERAARAVLSTPPPDGAAVRSSAAASLARAGERRDAAARAADEARQAVRAHARNHGFFGIVFGRQAVAELRKLEAAAGAAERRADLARGDYREEEAATRQAVSLAAPQADQAHQAWRRGPAADAADTLALAADERRQAGARPRAATPIPAVHGDPRTAAVRALHAAEQGHARDPAALARARLATGAALAGDAATVAAAARGDLAAAQAAAQEWQRRERERRQAEEAHRHVPARAAGTGFAPR